MINFGLIFAIKLKFNKNFNKIIKKGLQIKNTSWKRKLGGFTEKVLKGQNNWKNAKSLRK